MDLFKNFIFSNNQKVNKLFSDYNLNNNSNKEDLNSLFLETDIIEEIFENCISLIDFDCNFLNMNQGYFQDYSSKKFFIGEYNSIYFSINYSSEEEILPEINFFDELPLNHCYESCKEIFDWVEVLMEGYEEHKDNKEFIDNYSLEINWGFDFIDYLKNYGFETSLFLNTQRKIDLIT